MAAKTVNNTTSPIAWMVNNRVTPNLLMIIFIAGGLLMSSTIKREVFPAFALNTVTIAVSYPGASPEEIEQGIVLAVEEAISGMDEIDEIRSTASEGSARIIAELRDGIDITKAFQDIQAEVERISTLPVDAEEPIVSLDAIQRQVLRLNLYGDVEYRTLREAATLVKDHLLLYEPDEEMEESGGFFSGKTPWQGISQVEIDNPRDYEIDVAVPLQTLRRYNLTHEELAAKIKAASVELPGGKLQTAQGEILLRIKERNDLAEEFAKISLIKGSGASVRLGDIATVREGFEEGTKSRTFNGKPAIQLLVFRVGGETPITVSNDTYRAMRAMEAESLLPNGIKWQITNDFSTLYRDRLNLLLKNAFIGLLLVLVLLGLFLEIRLAFWVTMGIPVSFLGCLLFLPSFAISINMISMFAFIIALGIVVDDAIIAGENIYEYRKQGLSNVQAAIAGAKDVAVPITFSILTNIAAFMPMLFVPGVQGNIWRVIPTVVITTFVISWFESIFILPAHLGHSGGTKDGFFSRTIQKIQQLINRILYGFIQKIYLPSLHLATSLRYPFVVLMIAILVITLSYVKGRMRFILVPRVESNQAVVTATLPYGSPEEKLLAVQQQLLDALSTITTKYKGEELVKNTSSRLSENMLRIRAELSPPDIRPISTGELTKLWRKEVGEIHGLQSLLFESDRGGPGGGAAISIELSHRNIATLDRASATLAERLAEYPNAKDINQGYQPGKMQYTYQINERGSTLGLTATDVGRQIRSAFQGAVALRQLRGSNEVTVRVRLPESERQSEAILDRMQIKVPHGSGGGWVDLSAITSANRAPGYTSIARRDGRRTVTVTAGVDPIGETALIAKSLKDEVLPALIRQFPGLDWSFQGRQAERGESMSALGLGFLYALGGIFLLLAIPFRSYSQPVIVMIAIPFGIIGAVYGHILMGYNLSLMSMMGMVALSGVVVNDSLVLVDYANKRVWEGEEALAAIRMAGERRFRPVLLTTLTTFGGLAPMILETSRQARFMIPMAISLGFGILFATVITLTLVPCLYLIVEDLRKG